MAVTIAGFIGLWIHPVLWLLSLLWAWKGAASSTT
jgi:energy-converting hydrogenase Eha subunit G